MAKAVGDAVGKYWTYAKVAQAARIATGKISDATVSDALMLDLINAAIAEVCAETKHALPTTDATLTITGTANPYLCSIVNYVPLPDSIRDVFHVTGAGVRTPCVQVSTREEAESLVAMSSFSSSIFFVNEMDVLVLEKGSLFTVTIATDKIHLTYSRQPKMSTTVALTDYIDVLDKFGPVVLKKVIAMLAPEKK